MVQRTFNFNLRSTDFQLNSARQARTIIQPYGDDVRDNNKASVIYMRNVLPTEYGFAAVKIEKIEHPPADKTYVHIERVYGEGKEAVYLVWASDGEVYEVDPGFAFTAIPTGTHVVPLLDINNITVANVGGISYIWVVEQSAGPNRLGKGCFTYDESAGTLTPVTLAGITAISTLGVVSAAGYLIVYSEDSVAWSSTIDPIDFVPSSITGAGGGSVEYAAGKILVCLPTSNGFMIYTEGNVISAVYTGNSSYPFKFKAVENAGGGFTKKDIAYEEVSSVQYALTRYGIQALNADRAAIILPEVTTLLREESITDYDAASGLVEVGIDINEGNSIKLIASRWLVIAFSLTANTNTIAIVYDTILERYGQLYFETDIPEDVYEVSSFFSLVWRLDPRNLTQIAVLDSGGAIRGISFQPVDGDESIIAFGKLQYVSDRMLGLLEVTAESPNPFTDEFAVLDFPSLDGKNYQAAVTGAEQVVENDETIYTAHFLTDALNHTVVIKGIFALSNLEAVYTLRGRR